MGYCGGTTRAPTYRSIGDHTESFQVDFDPAVISYEALLDVFWGSHDPTRRTGCTQYESVLFFHDDAQRAAAERSRDAVARRLGAKVRTPLRPVGTFTQAEDYHQKYSLRHDRVLMAELERLLPAPDDFARSTAAMRLNAWLAGHAPAEQVERDLPRLGLSPDGVRYVREQVLR